MSVSSATGRVDLVLPAAVAVAELVPELARSVGLLDAATVHGGYHLLTPDGRRLTGDVGLAAQGVCDGGVLTVVAGAAAEPPRVFDDVAEAMADVVERDLQAWGPAAGRRAALAAAALLLPLAAVALVVLADRLLAGATAVVGAVLLTGGAVVLSRASDHHTAAVAAAWLGVGYAAVAGLLLAPGPPASSVGVPVATAGAGLLAAGAVALLGLARRRTLLLPAVAVGMVLLAVGLVLDAAPVRPATVLTTALVVVVIAGSMAPWLALGATSTRVDAAEIIDGAPAGAPADTSAEREAIDRSRVGADARTAHDLLLAMTATSGAALVVAGPFAVSLGAFGTALAVLCCGAVVLRTRQHRVASQVLTGLLAGIAGLVAVAVAVLVLHPAWRETTALALALAGASALVAAVVPASASVRRARLGDVAESVALLGLLPLLALATGLVDEVVHTVSG